MKVILSRKGFDMGCGGSPSIYSKSEGFLYSFPIPIFEKVSNNSEYKENYCYSDIIFKDDFTCKDVLQQLGNKNCNNYAHLDPDIRPEIFKSTQANWKPRFGQQGNPLRHLNKQNVGVNDLFLFYGLYSEVEKTENGYVFKSDIKCQIIWGYLQVSDMVIPDETNRTGIKHPHYLNYLDYEKCNKVYECNPDELLKSEYLSNKKRILRFGTFDFDESLVLSEKPGDKAEEYNKLKLPAHFYEHRMSGNGKGRFNLSEDKEYCMVQMCNRGQEFVIQDNEDAEKWAVSLIEKNYKG